MWWSRVWLVIGALCLITSACARAQAKTPVAATGLATPEPPDRVIIPAPPAPEVIEQAPPASVPARPRDPVPAPRQADRPSPSAPPAPSATVSPDPSPILLLQTNAKPAEAEQQIRAQMANAQRDLSRAAGRPLSTNGRAQLNTTRGLLRQADDALKAKNLTLARELADKAAALASQLAR